MSIEKMREEFEKWSATHDFLGGIEVDLAISGEYSDMDMQCAWESWKASREAIEIELPAAKSSRNNEVIKAVGRHILRQGLKVKT